jgi:hypothetical protein
MAAKMAKVRAAQMAQQQEMANAESSGMMMTGGHATQGAQMR